MSKKTTPPNRCSKEKTVLVLCAAKDFRERTRMVLGVMDGIEIIKK